MLNPERHTPYVGRMHCGLAAHQAARAMRYALAFTATVALAALTACGDDGVQASPTSSAGSVARPTVDLQASPAQVVAGQKVTLQWNASDAQSCTASGGWVGTQPTSGVQSINSPQTNTSYTLTCTGQGGSTAQSASVAVYTPISTVPISLICASAVVVGIQWSAATSATSYSISRNGKTLGSTALLTYTDQAVTASTAYTYVVEALDGTTELSTQTIDVATPAASTGGDAAYCPSTVISGMTWNWSTGFNQQNASDLWPATWGADGNTYFFWGDGQGFFGSTDNSSDKTSFGISKLAASAPAPGSIPGLITSDAINLYGGTNPVHPSTIHGKANGLIAIGSNFYALGGIYEEGDSGGPYGEPNHYEIVYSIGNAYSWVDNGTNWQFCSNNTSSTGFCPVSFVNFGPGNADAIDDYVYLLGSTEENFIGSGGSCGCTYLARVPNDQLLTKSAYQVYSGIDASGNPQWSSNWSEMQPIFVDNGPRPLPISKVVYNSVLKRFVGVGQGLVNQDAFYDAPNPWGPWTSIGYYNSNLDNSGGWGNLGTTSFEGGVSGDALGINFINAWTSSDGLTMWATFSSDGYASSGAYLAALQGQRMDSFSLVSVTLNLAQ
jgi:hypothetical protein